MEFPIPLDTAVPETGAPGAVVPRTAVLLLLAYPLEHTVVLSRKSSPAQTQKFALHTVHNRRTHGSRYAAENFKFLRLLAERARVATERDQRGRVPQQQVVVHTHDACEGPLS